MASLHILTSFSLLVFLVFNDVIVPNSILISFDLSYPIVSWEFHLEALWSKHYLEI